MPTQCKGFWEMTTKKTHRVQNPPELSQPLPEMVKTERDLRMFQPLQHCLDTVNNIFVLMWCCSSVLLTAGRGEWYEEGRIWKEESERKN